VARSAKQEWVEIGRIGSPFGIQGGMHVDSFTDPPEVLFDYEEWSVRLGNGERAGYRVSEARPQGQRFVVYVDGIEDRDAAARLTGGMIEVRRQDLPPTADREFYQADLIGFSVRNLEGAELGVVEYFIDAPAHPVMVVKGAKEHLVPAVPRHLQKVDLAAGLILVDWPEELG
jgi:16S rRNA processing protein RimM